MTKNNRTATLLLSCKDKKGLVAAISQFVFEQNGNIVHSDQHTDPEQGMFIMRIEWELEGFKIPKEKLAEAFAPVAKKFEMNWELKFSDTVPKMGIMVSKYDHCLYDLLLRKISGELEVEVPVIISNHDDLKPVADSFNVPFKVFRKDKNNKLEQEKNELHEFEKNKVDFIVLARYMQIISPVIISKYPNKIINIHHSFLPAFSGPKPYHNAYERGVKIIGATSHFITEELDAGPIIAQEVAKVSHRDHVDDLIRQGKDLERLVLARAVRLYLQNRIL
ncbi:MAG: formyltetrahydrofolate deformylase, partial [bacterium]